MRLSLLCMIKANIYCTPSMNCEVLDGFQLFQLGDIDNESQCEGYTDFIIFLRNIPKLY